MAIFYGLLAPELEVAAIGSVWGNAEVNTTTANALRLLEIAGRPEIPVAAGAPGPLVGPPRALGHAVHGADGQGNTHLSPPRLRPTRASAAAQLVRLGHEHPGELVLVALGPLTNLALALSLDPAIARLYREVVIMGGAFLAPGNVSPVAEANIWHDPEAAHVVLSAEWPVTLVGLDVTRKVRLTERVLERLRDSGTPWGLHLHRISAHYLSHYAQRWGRRECAMHDALALAIAADRSLALREVRTRVDIELAGTHTRGMTVADLRPGTVVESANASIVLEADGARFLERWEATLGAVGTATRPLSSPIE